MSPARRARSRFLLALLPALVAVVAVAPSGASAQEPGDLTVMTQNLYLGSSLAPALEASTQEEFIEAVSRIYATVQYTNFPARAEAVADEIQAEGPDLIGLQEVARWTVEGTVNPPPSYNFLEILQEELEARGLHYTTASISNNAFIGPVPLVGSGGSCPVQEGPKFTCTVTLEDRDVILVNEDTPGLTWSNSSSGRYAAQQAVKTPVGNLSFDRGWASIAAQLDGRPFHFVSTHLETEESPLVQEAQAAEFLAGPGAGESVIATGDFNSAADGSTTGSYAQVTAPGEFEDAWDESALGPGWSCCQQSNTPPLAPGALNNPVSTLATRIDLILSRGDASASGAAKLIGDAPFQAEPPFWPSDHAGVVAEINLAEPETESGSGSSGAGSSGSEGGGVGEPPAYQGLRFAPRRFAALGRSRGTKIAYRLSAPAQVVLVVQRRLRGRVAVVGGKRRCVRPASGLVRRHARPCKRFRNVGRFFRAGEAGVNRSDFAGWLGGRPLPPGAYRVISVAIDLRGQRSAIRRSWFAVQPFLP